MRGKEFPQKKVLSLVLCVAVMLSVMVMGAGAAFSDQDKIENTAAVDACSALNIIGAVGVAGAGAAIAAHAVGSAIHYRKQHMKDCLFYTSRCV